MTSLEGVLWLGGGTGSGKSTVARILEQRHGLRVYHYDRVEPGHAARLSRRQKEPGAQPSEVLRLVAMTLDERWVERTPEEMTRHSLACQDERFGCVLEDLISARVGAPVLAEGFGLRPELVAPLLPSPQQAFWLLPTPEFRAQSLEWSGRTWSLPNETSRPQRAYANLLERDRRLTEHDREQCVALGLGYLEVDGLLSAEQVASVVEAHFGLPQAA